MPWPFERMVPADNYKWEETIKAYDAIDTPSSVLSFVSIKQGDDKARFPQGCVGSDLSERPGRIRT